MGSSRKLKRCEISKQLQIVEITGLDSDARDNYLSDGKSSEETSQCTFVKRNV